MTNAYIEFANNRIRAMQRMNRGCCFDVLRAKMLYTAGVQRPEPRRYGLEPFSTALPKHGYVR